jgi:hypothetical protein
VQKLKGMFSCGGVENRWYSWMGRDVEPFLHWLDVVLYGIRSAQKWAEDEPHFKTWKEIRICAVFFNKLRKLAWGSRGHHNLSVDCCHNEIWHGWQYKIKSWQEKKRKEKDYAQSTFWREEHSDYHETTSRNIRHIYHSMPRHNKNCK